MTAGQTIRLDLYPRRRLPQSQSCRSRRAAALDGTDDREPKARTRPRTLGQAKSGLHDRRGRSRIRRRGDGAAPRRFRPRHQRRRVDIERRPSPRRLTATRTFTRAGRGSAGTGPIPSHDSADVGGSCSLDAVGAGEKPCPTDRGMRNLTEENEKMRRILFLTLVAGLAALGVDKPGSRRDPISNRGPRVPDALDLFGRRREVFREATSKRPSGEVKAGSPRRSRSAFPRASPISPNASRPRS